MALAACASGGGFIQKEGVYIQDASGNMIGGTVAGAGNVISGNKSTGVFILSQSGSSQGNSVQGNFIGLGENGVRGPGNGRFGIALGSSPKNTIGRTGAAVNRFGGNVAANIFRYTAATSAALPLVSPSLPASQSIRPGKAKPPREHRPIARQARLKVTDVQEVRTKDVNRRR